MPETAEEQLNNSMQKYGETLEEWADRVLQLSTRAFPVLPEEYMFKQAIKRICHGCLDREAGQYVVNQNLSSVELVVDKIKCYQFNHMSIYDQTESGEDRSATSSSESSEDDYSVQVRRIKHARNKHIGPCRRSFDRGRKSGRIFLGNPDRGSRYNCSAPRSPASGVDVKNSDQRRRPTWIVGP